MSATCRECGHALRSDNVERGTCDVCDAAPMADLDLRILEPEPLLEAVAGVLLLGAARRPEDRIHVQAELEALGILTDNVDVHKAVEKLRRRYGWRVDAIEGLPGYRLERWPFKFTRKRRTQLQLFTRRY